MALIRHGRHGFGESYVALMHHPPNTLLYDLLGGTKRIPEIVQKAASRRECEGGRWITVHPNGDEEDGHPIYICPNTDGSYTVTNGAGGKLNGLRLDHVRSEEEYKTLAAQRQHERQQAARLTEAQRLVSLGTQEYEQQRQLKQSEQQRLAGEHQDAERAFIATVAKAQGVDLAQFEPSPEQLRDIEPTIAERVKRDAHKAALSWANEVTKKTRELVVGAYDDLARDECADVASSAIDAMTTEDRGKGYQAHIKEMAQEHGLTTGKVKREQHNTSMQRLLEQNDYDLETAQRKRAGMLRLQAGAQRAQAELKGAKQSLKEEGQGPHAIQALDTTPTVQKMDQAVELLRAQATLKEKQRQIDARRKEVSGSDDLRDLPKAAVVEASPSTPAEQLKGIADSLTEDAQRQAMLRIVNSANDLESHYGTLRQHLSSGQAAAFGELAQAVDGSTLDPLTLDTLGPSAAARVLAHRWRTSMPTEEFNAVRQALVEQHIATQTKVANDGADIADRLMDMADELPDVQAETGEELQGALAQHSEKVALIRRAREAAGTAKGRLEAAAALNEALLHGSDKPVQVSLGEVSTRDALEQAYAIGLTKPAKFDDEEKLIDPGEFRIVGDGANRILRIEPEGLATLAAASAPDPQLRERAARSAAIKAGAEDDPDWLPEGIARRPATTFDLDPTAFRSIDTALSLNPSDSADMMGEMLRDHIAARINAGQDAFDVQADIHSASFIEGLGLDDAGQRRYNKVVNEVAPFKIVKFTKDVTSAEGREQFAAHRQAIRDRLEGYADSAAEGIDRQHIPVEPVAQDCAYQAALRDPRTAYSFTPLGDLDRAGRDAIRSYALEHLFKPEFEKQFGGRVPEATEPITPLEAPERHAYDEWQSLKAKGNPYGQIQASWRDSAKAEASNSMFGDEEEPPALASVDLGNPADVIKVGRENASALGYQAITDAHGKKTYPFLEPGTDWQEANDTGTLTKQKGRSDETIVSELRGKIRAKLREHWLSDQAGLPDVAERGFNPDSVKTVSSRWTNYCRDMGGEKRAIRTVQELMKGDLCARFAAAYQSRTGKKLDVANRTLQHAQNHREAMLPAEQREAVTARKRGRYAESGRGKGGQFEQGERREKVEQQEAAEKEGGALFGASEAEWPSEVGTRRASLGKAAEGTIASMMPYINCNGPVDVASNVSMAGNAINRQRATKLILANKRQGLNLAAGAGKAQPLDAQVLTPDGFVPMGCVDVGMQVIAGDGTLSTVTGVFPQGEREIYLVTFSDGSSTQCCEEHLWLTQTSTQRSDYQRTAKRRDAAKYPGCAYDTGRYEPTVRTLSEIRTSLTDRGRVNHSIPMVGAVEFESSSVPIDPYLLGVLLGDGGLTGYTPVLTTVDDELLDLVRERLPEGMEVRHNSKCSYHLAGGHITQTVEISGPRHGHYVRQVSVNPLRLALSALELWGEGSHRKFIPTHYIINDANVRLEVLRGLMDTDGTVNKTGTSCYFYTVSPLLAEDVTMLVRSLGGITRTSTKEPTYVHNGERRKGSTCYVVNITMPPHLNPFRLTRKANLVKPKTKYAPTRYIVSVEPVGRKLAQCIMIDHPSHLYVTDDFIVTHNTICLVGAFTDAFKRGEAHKALYVVPSNIVGQFSGEFYKFIDPSAGLRWHSDPGATAEERRTAYADPNTQMCVVTPEALRGDVTALVAKELGVSVGTATERSCRHV